MPIVNKIDYCKKDFIYIYIFTFFIASEAITASSIAVFENLFI